MYRFEQYYAIPKAKHKAKLKAMQKEIDQQDKPNMSDTFLAIQFDYQAIYIRNIQKVNMSKSNFLNLKTEE